MITIDDFKELDIKIGTVTEAKQVEDADKLIALTVDFGNETRTILTAVREFFEPEHFLGKQIPFLINLESRKFRGVESQGMMLAIDEKGTPVLLHPEKKVKSGSSIL